jgi:hypothetical protein
MRAAALVLPSCLLLLACSSDRSTGAAPSDGGTVAAGDDGRASSDGGGSPADGGGAPADGGGAPADGGGAPADGGGASAVDPGIVAMVGQIDAGNLSTTVAKLSGFTTRNTCSDDTTGANAIGDARDWIKAQL